MPRIEIPVALLPGSGGMEDAIAVTVRNGSIAGDPVEGHYWDLQAGDMLWVINQDATPHNLTLYSTPNARGRRLAEDGTTTEEIAGSNAMAIFGPFHLDGWAQSSVGNEGRMFVDADNANLFLRVLRKAKA